MVLVKNLVNYFFYILSIKAAYCNPFCKRLIRGSYNYYIKSDKTKQENNYILNR